MGGHPKKIIDIVELASKNRLTLPLEVRKIMKIKKGDYVMFTREKDGILLRRIDKFAVDVTDGKTGDQIIINQSDVRTLRGMNPQHVEILTILKKHSLTSEEIADKIDTTGDSVRGRISELRNTYGFNIMLDDITKRYTWKE
jgi:AbrB family looped-hinge helix DNA binding protein